jgi:hypothetical protein
MIGRGIGSPGVNTISKSMQFFKLWQAFYGLF